MSQATSALLTRLAQLGDRERRLLARMEHHEIVSRDLNAAYDQQLTLGERVADRVAATMGSWRFIITQSLLLAAWIALNVFAWVQQWDPYPFILLNLMLSFQAAYAAPIIMMSQNRQEDKDRLRAEHDYEVNLKAEAEIAELHVKLDALREAQWEELLTVQRRQIALLEQLVAERQRPA
jgi:uncharacterized membrane protein